MRKVQFVESGEISSNRTFMELKFAYDTNELALVQVLIVPLWN